MLDETLRRGTELAGIRPHELPGDGMLLFVDVHNVVRARALANLQDELIEQNFAQRIWRAQAASDQPHRRVAVATERRLHDGKVERDRANGQRLGDGVEHALYCRWGVGIVNSPGPRGGRARDKH